MIFPGRPLCKSTVTHSALEWSFVRVNPFVVHQVVSLCKCLWTDLASKRLFTPVDLVVMLKVALQFEYFRTDGAIVAFLLCVHLFVLGDVTLLVRGVCTEAALV